MKDIIQAVGLLFMLIAIFIGLLFFNNSNLLLTSIESILLIGALSGLVYVLIQMKTTESSQRTMIFRIEMVTLIIGYGITAMITFYFFVHFFNIEFSLKQEIQDDISQSLQKMETALQEYKEHVEDRREVYEVQLKNAVARGKMLEKDIEPKLNALTEKLKMGFDTEKQNTQSFTEQGKATIANWSYLKVPKLIFEISRRQQELGEKLVALSQSTTLDQGDTFTHSLGSGGSYNLSDPSKYLHRTKWPLPLALFLILHLMVLWSYIFAERSRTGIPDGGEPDGKHSGTL